MNINEMITALDNALFEQKETTQVMFTQKVIDALYELQELRTLRDLTGWKKLDDWKRSLQPDVKGRRIKCYLIYKGSIKASYYDPTDNMFHFSKFGRNGCYMTECIKWVRTI